jgi:hypothetical protein
MIYTFMYIDTYLHVLSSYLRNHCTCYITKHNSYVYPLVNYHALKYTSILNFNT